MTYFLFDIEKCVYLPNCDYVIRRMFIMYYDGLTKQEVKRHVARELRYIWIFYNVYPQSYTSVFKKVSTLFEKMDRLCRTSQEKRGPRGMTM